MKELKAKIRSVIKHIFGESIFIAYHTLLANLATVYYGNPSQKMYVVAVTGTKGKTSTLNFLWHVLTLGGYKVGLISTANIRIGNTEIMNWYHMTMPGRFLLQKLMRRMYKEECDIVLVEVTSEGIKMGRLSGLAYDVAVFTNLHPEHLQSHGNSFEKYRAEKAKLFSGLIKQPRKNILGKEQEKVSIINVDNPEGNFFLNFPADKKYTYGVEVGEFRIENILENPGGVSFSVNNDNFEIPILGKFNIYNAMPAVLLAKHLDIEPKKVIAGVKNCALIPGRMEIINEGQKYTCIVDYAHEGVSFREALIAARSAKKTTANKVVAVFGGEGGGRDISKREKMSRVAADLADYAIVTLSDPFDTDPKEINRDIMNWLEKYGFEEGKTAWEFIDRRVAIRKALDLVQEGDVILFASKGSEQSIVFKDRVEKWDDRQEVRKALRERL